MQLRANNLAELTGETFDVLIIGGGINGAVSAAALAGRGVRVALIDARDFAGFTSQNSSNLAWGGIKYMESYDFGLVWGLCKSRNLLIRSYPSAVKEIRFLTTISKTFRQPKWMVWAGTWLYWLFGRGFTKTPRLLSAARIRQEEPAVNVTEATGGVEYSDAYLHDNDARFVFDFIRTAMDHGCIAANYVESVSAERTSDGLWATQAQDRIGGGRFEIKSRVLLNAAGPFVDQHNSMTGTSTQYSHVLSKGIHLIVKRITPNNRVLAFFAEDGRLFFAIPMFKCTCIGTTDTRVDDPHVTVTDEDREFVLSNINKMLSLDKPLGKEDIIAERCGVRPLVLKKGADAGADFLNLSRKHIVEVDRQRTHLSIFGGKLTDCINVGNEICDEVAQMGVDIPRGDHKWFGEPDDAVRQEYLRRARDLHLDGHRIPEEYEQLTTRLWRRYGKNALALLDEIEKDPRQAELLIEGTEYRRCEIRYTAQREMVVKLEDFLRRRSKISLVTPHDEIRAAPGLKEACRILFGDQAETRFAEYFGQDDERSATAG